jgi:hypothetical protein
LLAAVAGARLLTQGVITSVTTEVIAFFTIQAAVIFPAMMFTAGLLRGDGLTVAEVEQYRAALRRQMHFWVILLCLDLAAVFLLIVGKAADWKWKISISGHSADFGFVIIWLAVLVGTLAVLRMAPFVRGVLSLLEMNGWLVKKSVQARERHEASPKTEIEPQQITLPEGYGRIVPHRRAPGASKGRR